MGARTGKYKFGARAGKHNLGARAGKYKLGARARAVGQAKGRGREIQIPHLFKLFRMAEIFMNLMLKQEQAYITIETKGSKQTTN